MIPIIMFSNQTHLRKGPPFGPFLLIFPLLLLSFYSVMGQKTITFDFNDEKGEKELLCNKLEKLSPGDFYQVKIKNINLNLYEVTLHSRDTTVAQKLNVPTLGSFDLEVIGGLFDQAGGLVSKPIKIDSDEIGQKNVNGQSPAPRQPKDSITSIFDRRNG